MPYGNSAMAPIVEAHYRKFRTPNVLDIGAGYGFWGAFIRTYFGSNDRGRIGQVSGEWNYPWEGCWKNNDTPRITGIEPFTAYRNPMWALYNGGMREQRVEEVMGDVVDACRFSFVLCIDVMEHLRSEVALDIFNATKRGVFGICNLKYDKPQAPYGNSLEDHITQFDPNAFRQAGCEVIVLNPLYFAVTVDR